MDELIKKNIELMFRRRNYAKLQWNTLTKGITEDGRVFVCLIQDFNSLGTILEEETDCEIKIGVIWELSMKKNLAQMNEVWSHVDFLYDPFSITHGVPMRLLTPQEKQEKVIDSWDNEAKISHTDICARYLNAKKGDIFEILQNYRIPVVLSYRQVI